ncbi:MAG: CZB domain-containing protein [Magnetospirillum sp.]|nr:CZB domain-containing protein [Magnetospirillum sp.]
MLAKADHVLWKKRLVDMLIGRTALRAEELSSEQQCRLGKWYYGPGSMPFRSHPAFAALEEPHRQVHREGIEAVRAYNAGQVEIAMERIARVQQASLGVLANLDRLLEAPTTPSAGRGAF